MTGKARCVMPEREFGGVGMTGEPLAPAKKKKQVCDVCGAPTKLMSENKSTRQKEKASLRRVRSAQQANVREQKHPPKRKSFVGITPSIVVCVCPFSIGFLAARKFVRTDSEI